MIKRIVNYILDCIYEHNKKNAEKVQVNDLTKNITYGAGLTGISLSLDDYILLPEELRLRYESGILERRKLEFKLLSSVIANPAGMLIDSMSNLQKILYFRNILEVAKAIGESNN